MPFNATTGRRYSGVNILTLWEAVITRGIAGHGFLTFRPAINLGGAVRRGERGVTIVFAHVLGDRSTATGGDEPEGRTRHAIPFLKRFTVFSTDQCEGLPENIAAPLPPVPEGLIRPETEALIQVTGARFRIGGPSAFYYRVNDRW